MLMDYGPQVMGLKIFVQKISPQLNYRCMFFYLVYT